MVWTSLLLGLLAGLILGAMAAAWVNRSRAASALEPLRQAHAASKEDLEVRITEREAQLRELQHEFNKVNGLLATELQRNEGMAEKLETQRTELEALNERMTKEFKHIASSLLEEKGKQLTDQQEDRLKLLLNPFGDKIKEFQEQVRTAYEKEGKERFHLKNEVAKLVEQNQKLSQDADNLTRALKGDRQSQGAWGEMILDKLLEDSGLVKGQE